MAVLHFAWMEDELDKQARPSYERVQMGMTLDEVENILGPGERTDSPETPTGVLVQGNPVYRWLYTRPAPVNPDPNGYQVLDPYRRVYVGFRDGKACDKHYWKLAP
jgi:hypothetical protein